MQAEARQDAGIGGCDHFAAGFGILFQKLRDLFKSDVVRAASGFSPGLFDFGRNKRQAGIFRDFGADLGDFCASRHGRAPSRNHRRVQIDALFHHVFDQGIEAGRIHQAFGIVAALFHFLGPAHFLEDGPGQRVGVFHVLQTDA